MRKIKQPVPIGPCGPAWRKCEVPAGKRGASSRRGVWPLGHPRLPTALACKNHPPHPDLTAGPRCHPHLHWDPQNATAPHIWPTLPLLSSGFCTASPSAGISGSLLLADFSAFWSLLDSTSSRKSSCISSKLSWPPLPLPSSYCLSLFVSPTRP